ncbi:DUF1345 domain-containing protein [Humibacter ginsenosidimutans]|uniref:DUF1345 domain-containing protein n=1 Tax=Humibacter ginsenosidimutans TaxID=2599293 RepID=A0A5B8M6M4_9MICO|nr:DUF1345 domain-containing protein [Humibacter ginsenosidimutans]QDZ15160.1 DUF1345 domain-containing protein [Humibacter ginsenosidimutans]
MATGAAKKRRWFDHRSHLRLLVMLVVGLLVGGLSALLGAEGNAPVLGWDAACVAYILWSWLSIRRLDDEATRQHATKEDPTRTSADVLLISASIASLGAIAIGLAESHSGGSLARAMSPALAVASVALSWLLVHMLFTLRYARLYYTEPVGGVDFNMDEPPHYVDFAYLAFTVGMTFQVSDTDLNSREIRAAVLRHMLLSYLFGSVIVATTVNLVAGLGAS